MRYLVFVDVIILGFIFMLSGSFLIFARASASESVCINGEWYESLDDFESSCKEEFKVFADSKYDDACVSYTYDISSIEDRDLITIVLDHFRATDYEVRIDREIDKDRLRRMLLAYNSEAFESMDAEIVCTVSCYEILDEVYGSQVDIDRLLKDVDTGFDIQLSDYYIDPVVKASDLEEECRELNNRGI